MALGFWWLPFGLSFAGIWIIVSLIVLIFWIWMIVDCIKRRFVKDGEKVLWIIIIIIGGWIGALVYLVMIRAANPHGLIKR